MAKAWQWFTILPAKSKSQAHKFIPYHQLARVKGNKHLTHLNRTAIANSVVECILPAKTLALNLTEMEWRRDQKLAEEVLIDIANVANSSDCENRTGKDILQEIRHTVLGFAGCHSHERRIVTKWI